MELSLAFLRGFRFSRISVVFKEGRERTRISKDAPTRTAENEYRGVNAKRFFAEVAPRHKTLAVRHVAERRSFQIQASGVFPRGVHSTPTSRHYIQ